MNSVCKIKENFYKLKNLFPYTLSSVSWIIVFMIELWFRPKLYNFVYFLYIIVLNILNIEKNLFYFDFSYLILESIIAAFTFISLIRSIFYLSMWFISFIVSITKRPKVLKLKRLSLYKLYKSNTLCFDTLMYSIIWIIYCLLLPNSLFSFFNGPSEYIFAKAITLLIITFIGAIIIWFFYFKDCYKIMKRNFYFSEDSEFLFIFVRLLRPILVAVVAWVVIVANFILNFETSCDNIKKIITFSCIINNLVTLYYPLIDIFAYAYNQLYKN